MNMVHAKPSASRTQLAAHWWLARESLLGAAVSVAAAVPLCLIVAPMPWRLIGIVYAIPYGFFLLLSSATYLYMCVDAVNIAMGREPTFLPRVLTAVRSQGGSKRPGPLARIVFRANPLMNLSISLLISAARINAKTFIRVWAAESGPTRRTGDPGRSAEPPVEFAKPVVRAVERELQYC